MRFAKKKEDAASIPTASMADIAFLLILFFMVTTVFRAETGIPVKLPTAEMGRKLPNKGIVHIYASNSGNISINDNNYQEPGILDNVKTNAIGPKYNRIFENRQIRKI